MLDENLQTYRNWLLNITICDPACGSGAFLNQALEFLIEEHTYIDELESQLLGHAFEFPGVENHILEKIFLALTLTMKVLILPNFRCGYELHKKAENLPV